MKSDPKTAVWDTMIGKEIVVDTCCNFIYLGKLVEVDEHFVVLQDVDVHDRTDGSSTNERYVMETRKEGIRKNRNRASVRMSLVVSVSLLEDVVTY
ncbi:MAG: hypothetical protein RDV41_15820 [Planctomycetota bacterium]|nr:hypothetical protein [Planctomycetota bacterium]